MKRVRIMLVRTMVLLSCCVFSALVVTAQGQDVGRTSWDAPPFQKEIYDHTGIAAISGLSPSRLFWKDNPDVTQNLAIIIKGVNNKESNGIIAFFGMQRWEDTFDHTAPGGKLADLPGRPQWYEWLNDREYLWAK